MISAEYCVLMADYHSWMNRKLYALCAELGDDERRRDRGAFFRSIHGTLNHLMFGDLAVMARFAGKPDEVPELGRELFADFGELRLAREALDARIREWAQGLTPEWLAGDLTYVSKVDGRTRTIRKCILAVQMFNHATHHRGQLTTLLTQMGRDIGATDIPFMERPDGGRVF